MAILLKGKCHTPNIIHDVKMVRTQGIQVAQMTTDCSFVHMYIECTSNTLLNNEICRPDRD